ncbi:LacI family DNA-binding transcriptional regulator [Kutzneria sp. CA-103260]|uniref:LacI family DNA-binding transcriptional regulator n=1 Tax=Kutzneria sp. CA-103260 TaxID=2802641 RepID=UPI001BAC705B|nr:LacI family DNA-binding transcriptional regulator [Kutzneria sp. CA-103260]QUQ65853.1 LacI family transcriptional regulator [Kutzneria sp. CA-103260]
MVTIVDVARAAGVAPSTVSYVLSGKRSISARTRRAVEQSIRQLGYHPNAGARSLASHRTNVLSLMAPLREDLNNPGVMEFVAAVATAARGHDQDLLLLTKDEGASALRRVASSALADALIVMDVELADPRIPTLLSLGRPVVLIGEPAEATGLAAVDLDYTAAGVRCVDHLADLGHRAVALLGPHRPDIPAARRFRHGFAATAQARCVEATVHQCGHEYEAIRACLDELLTTEPTAIVVHNEAALPTVLAELQRRGLRVPEDLSVVAVCRDAMATSGPVPLTSVAIPVAELAELAVRMTLREAPAETQLLAPRLTQRASTR